MIDPTGEGDRGQPQRDPEDEAIEFFTQSAKNYITQAILDMPVATRAEIGTALILSLEHGHPDNEEAKKLIAHLMSVTPEAHVSAVLKHLWDLYPDDPGDLPEDDHLQVSDA